MPVEHADCWVQGAGHTAGSQLSRGAEPAQPGHSPTELQDQAVGTGRGTIWPPVQEGTGVKGGDNQGRRLTKELQPGTVKESKVLAGMRLERQSLNSRWI